MNYNKKNGLKVKFAFILALTLVISSFSPAIAQNSTTPPTIDEIPHEQMIFFENQTQSLETYRTVKDTLFAATDAYGGIYIDESGNLNILVVDSGDRTTLTTLQNVIEPQQKRNQTIIYTAATYSFEYLQEVQNRFSDKMLELNIAATWIDETRNLIVITPRSESINKEQIIELAGSEDIIAFEEPNIIEELATTIKNGSMASGFLGNFSLACGAKLGNTYGFITAAHCVTLNEVIRSNGTMVGTATKMNYGGEADVAFITRGSSSSLSTTVFTDDTSYTSGNGGGAIGTAGFVGGVYPVGTQITKYGITTGVTSGKVLTLQYSYTKEDGVVFKNLVKATAHCNSGDSGGPVKMQTTSSGLTYTYLIGINHAKAIAYDGTVSLLFTDMEKAKRTLGFVGYYDVPY